MTPEDYSCWPKYQPHRLTPPATSLVYNLEVSAKRFPGKPIALFYDSRLDYRTFLHQTEQLAGFLQKRCGVKKSDRVLLDLQNSPQFMLAYYAILRADAVVVPVSPMNVTEELLHYCSDSGAQTAFVGQEVYARMQPLMGSAVKHAIVATYSDYLSEKPKLDMPDFLRAPREKISDAGAVPWAEVLAANYVPLPWQAGPDDLAAILYTSGTTGKPKGCMHTHASIMHSTVGAALWEQMCQESVILSTAPMFHVTGMQHSLNAGIYSGATIVLLPRWDPAAAAYLIERARCTHWANVPTMVVDLLAHSSTDKRDLSSLQNIFGGGSAMPEAVAQKLFDRCGIEYMEAYGMTETISQTHMNPPGELRKQCLGIPTFDTECLIIHPETAQPLGVDEAGEIVARGPQIMKGYWNNPEATKAAFVQIDDKIFLRTGDLGRVDASGFFYMADRLKRMINAAGFKVWPAEVEMTLYQHPDIKEVAIISAPDSRRGETVKAVVVLKEGMQLPVEALIEWCREHMAAYKVPRQIVFTDALPRSGSGKIQWRQLQEAEWLGQAADLGKS